MHCTVSIPPLFWGVDARKPTPIQPSTSGAAYAGHVNKITGYSMAKI